MSNSDLPEVPAEGKKAVAVIAGSAVTGAVLGSLIPGVGTAIGAGAGGAIGSIVVIINAISK
ncbi:MAG: hypothetical protein FWD26_03495 [Treponema sp.]|nr:hypothetical protein [Treponema sp.]